jgi:hypothetical protein
MYRAYLKNSSPFLMDMHFTIVKGSDPFRALMQKSSSPKTTAREGIMSVYAEYSFYLS